MTLKFGSSKPELTKARKLFEKAVEIDPGLAEARLHLGRVMGLLGDHERATEELQKAAAAVVDPQLQYYCRLYLGNELASLNNNREARKQFELAAILYPGAQSPLLSLSGIAGFSGDHERALGYIDTLITLPEGERLWRIRGGFTTYRTFVTHRC